MKKALLLLFSFNLYAQITLPQNSEQLLLVSAEGFEKSQALLQAYEKYEGKWHKRFEPISVNLGRNGLAWGEGLMTFEHKSDEPLKHEGDGKSPAGLFSLDLFFGYGDESFDFPYLRVDHSTLCIDDTSSQSYNQIIQDGSANTTQEEGAFQKHPEFKSFEYMKREDNLYRLGIVVGHNKNALAGQGSCIFIHIQKSENSATSGCTSLHEEQLLRLMKWLNIEKKPLLLQLPKSYLHEGFE